jgi:hypothetical protein
LPDFAAPLLSSTDPDEPADARFALDTVTVPEPELKLSPDAIVTAPPSPFPALLPALIDNAPPASVPDVVMPAFTTTAPPTPDVPLPTTTLIAPPWPPVDEPLSTDSQPLLPDFDVPLLNSTVPDEPDDATFAVDTDTLPLPLLKLAPLAISTRPPTPLPAALPARTVTTPPVAPADDVSPANIITSPPTPDVPLPTTMLSEPP